MQIDPKVGKLPSWARAYISLLHEQLAEAEKRARQVEGSEDTNVTYGCRTAEDYSQKPLPKHTRVQFRWRGGVVVCGVYPDESGVEVYVLSGSIIVLPEAANYIVVRGGSHYED